MSQSTPVAMPVLDATLSGQQVIEASAGTGKTWTISGLYLRLLLEQGADVRQILAITFTLAAAAELRDRIRARIAAALLALDKGVTGDDPLLPVLLERVGDQDLAKRRLAMALRSFDEARIHTIHGFCQRALADHAFRSGVPFQCELLADPSAIVHEVAADWWRSHVAGGTAAGEGAAERQLLVSWLRAKQQGLDALESLALRYARRPGLTFRPPAVPPDLPARLAALRTAHAAARQAWGQQASEAAPLLLQPGLSQVSFKPKSVEESRQGLAIYFQLPGASVVLPKKAKLFAAATIASSVKKGHVAPVHPVFDRIQALVDAAAAAGEALEQWWAAHRLAFLAEAGPRIGAELTRRNLQSFDDLLLKLHAAVSADGGAELARALRTACPYALVDEFQDTDPLQWGIVRTVWGGDGPGALFLVGDPKQAIYGFRGADVFAYLAAVGEVKERLPLAENQRSVPGLVRAMNAVFGRVDNPFRHEGIDYVEVTASPRLKVPLVDGDGEDAAPFRIAVVPPRADGKPVAKGEATDWAVNTTVAEIARLLAAGRAQLGGRPLASGDIAVLTNTNRQATLVREALAERGISSAELSTLSVFDSLEAEQLQRLLMAMAAPRDASAVRAALLTDLVGLDAAQVLALEDGVRWERVLGEFAVHHETWLRHGVMRALRELFRARGTYARLASFRNGERRLTNVYHLSELLNQEAQRRHGMDSLLAWFAARRDSQVSEDMQLRLDNDANLVQIVTVHRSKGLEYPVTFVPFLWDFTSHAGKLPGLVLYHDPNQQLVLDGTDREAGLGVARDEEIGEKLRQAYVALTRAKNRCYLFTGHINQAGSSALGQLGLLPKLPGELDGLCREASGDIALFQSPDSPPPAARADLAEESPLVVRSPTHAARSGYVMSSFTGLQRGAVVPAAASARDHDQTVALGAATGVAAADEIDIRTAFRGGAAAGNCLHRILEHADFAQQDRDGRVAAELARAGFDPGQASAVGAWLRDTLATPLPLAGDAVPLSQIPRSAQWRELEFQLAAPQLEPMRLVDAAREHGVAVPELQPGKLQGYLAGAIDLVYVHAGRWYVADYKSNRLSGPGGYEAAGVQQAMAHGGYHLQYLLYTVAVHRWLRATLKDYDYQRHFGGVHYLFLRGMHPMWVDGGVPRGVYSTRPALALVEALDACLGAVASRAGA